MNSKTVSITASTPSKIDEHADSLEIARLFGHTSTRTYAGENRRLRLEDERDADHPLTQQLCFTN